ncbi:cyclin-B2-2 [Acrasis kona]|uniref:Cyclin-B2-2 n=1 Tax=Acrasis kona TaxID=1008807 RepID=A0AAW2Z7L9_9EUKA
MRADRQALHDITNAISGDTNLARNTFKVEKPFSFYKPPIKRINMERHNTVWEDLEYDFCLEGKRHLRPNPNYLTTQPEINDQNRKTLFDWIIQVCDYKNFHDETIFLCCNLIDRFLGTCNVNRPKLQLVGSVALLISSKYLEVEFLTIEVLILFCDNIYSHKEHVDMEQLMTNNLEWSFTVSTPLEFVQKYCILLNLNKDVIDSAIYYCALDLMNYRSLHHRPSVIAAAALVASLHEHSLSLWDLEIQNMTQCKFQEVSDLADGMIATKKIARALPVFACLIEQTEKKNQNTTTYIDTFSLPHMSRIAIYEHRFVFVDLKITCYDE